MTNSDLGASMAHTGKYKSLTLKRLQTWLFNSGGTPIQKLQMANYRELWSLLFPQEIMGFYGISSPEQLTFISLYIYVVGVDIESLGQGLKLGGTAIWTTKLLLPYYRI